MKEKTFYDYTPFRYGFSSEIDLINAMNPLLKQLMERNSGKVFYDIGCGCGRNLVYATQLAKKVIGVDISSVSLGFAKELISSNNLDLIKGNNLNIPLKSNTADIVVSDGVCHHTGDTLKAFKECIRVLKPSGKLYLAVYKKFRYYPLIYFSIGALFRLFNKLEFGKFIIEYIFIRLYFIIYRTIKNNKLSFSETRNIFFDYFLTPVATFQSKRDVTIWCNENKCSVIDYMSTSGNCHVFIINKNE